LNGANRPGVVLDSEIAVIEVGMDSIFDELIIAVILAFGREGISPMRALRQFTTRTELHAAH
jgi:hypothetical protein